MADEIQNNVFDQIPQCQVIWFKWDTPDEDVFEQVDLVDPGNLSKASAYDISRHIEYCSFSKSKSDPAGGFSLKLDSSRDWKDWIKPGEWLLILMTQDGDLFADSPANQEVATFQSAESGTSLEFVIAPNEIKKDKIRGICYVDRVAVDVTTGDKGEFISNYQVTGRDFGVVYQDTELWYSQFLAETPFLDSLKKANIESQPFSSVTNLIRIAHGMFLATDSPAEPLIKNLSDALDLPTQWLLPKPMLKLIGQMPDRDSYYGNLPDVLKLDETPVSIPIMNPLLHIQGNKAWEKLKEYSVEPLHELFTETDNEGKMHLYFRAIPWSLDPSGYPRLNHIKKFQDLVADDSSRIDLRAEQLLSLNLGEDNHSRYNHFLLELRPDFMRSVSSLTLLSKPSAKGRKFPLVNKPSVTRHGFRPMHISLDSFFTGYFGNSDKNTKKNSETAADPVIDFNEVMYDYWSNFIFFESGTLEIVGLNSVKIGKVLKLDSSFQYNPNSVYYIEGYQDEFIVNGNGASSWTQSISVTHGIEEVDLDTKSRTSGGSRGFSRKDREFSKTSTFHKKG